MALFDTSANADDAPDESASGGIGLPGATPDQASAEDVHLLHQVGQGDHDAMAAVYARYSRVVYSVALRVLRDAGAAEDVLQEIFLQIWRNPERFLAARGSLGSWLAVVARNRSIDVLRRRRPVSEIEDLILASPFNLAEDSERTLMMQRARVVMQSLPTPQRRVLELAYFEGLTHTEIAQETGDPLGTVKTRIRSALMTLRKAMEPPAP